MEFPIIHDKFAMALGRIQIQGTLFTAESACIVELTQGKLDGFTRNLLLTSGAFPRLPFILINSFMHDVPDDLPPDYYMVWLRGFLCVFNHRKVRFPSWTRWFQRLHPLRATSGSLYDLSARGQIFRCKIVDDSWCTTSWTLLKTCESRKKKEEITTFSKLSSNLWICFCLSPVCSLVSNIRLLFYAVRRFLSGCSSSSGSVSGRDVALDALLIRWRPDSSCSSLFDSQRNPSELEILNLFGFLPC